MATTNTTTTKNPDGSTKETTFTISGSNRGEKPKKTDWSKLVKDLLKFISAANKR
jgi:hypothetical protein